MTQPNSQNSAAQNTPASSGTLVEETPLGLSKEQMEKSNPGAVKELQENALRADRERLTALNAAFPEDPAFAMQSYTDGLSVEAAKAKRYGVIAPKVAALEAENKDLKAKVDGNKVTLTLSDKNETSLEGKTTDDVEAEALKIWEADADLRAEFGGEKSAFLAVFKRDPKGFRPKK